MKSLPQGRKTSPNVKTTAIDSVLTINTISSDESDSRKVAGRFFGKSDMTRFSSTKMCGQGIGILCATFVISNGWVIVGRGDRCAPDAGRQLVGASSQHRL